MTTTEPYHQTTPIPADQNHGGPDAGERTRGPRRRPSDRAGFPSGTPLSEFDTREYVVGVLQDEVTRLEQEAQEQQNEPARVRAMREMGLGKLDGVIRQLQGQP